MVKSSIQLFRSFLIIALISSSSGLKCFQCISRNGGNRLCEQPQPAEYQLSDCYVRSAFGTQEAGKYCVAMKTVSRKSSIRETKYRFLNSNLTLIICLSYSGDERNCPVSNLHFWKTSLLWSSQLWIWIIWRLSTIVYFRWMQWWRTSCYGLWVWSSEPTL